MSKKILFFDIETSTLDIRHRTYDLKNHIKYFNYKEIERDWIMLGAAWKWIDEPTAQVVSIRPQDPLNDYGVVKTLRDVVDRADLLVGHNIDRFDVRKMNARLIKYGLEPIGKKATYDTLKAARRVFAFTSNTLGYLADFLGVGHKENRPDWDAILEGDPDAISYMRLYNKQDVIVNEAIYHKLRPWDESHPQMDKIYPVKDIEGKVIDSCPACNSVNTCPNGSAIRTRHRVYVRRCKDCGRRYAAGKVK